MNAYNPKIHHRRSIRLKGYDYSQDGLYFVTICCENKECRFGNIKDGEMYLNEYGEIAYTQWLKLAERFANFELDVFQIMPNHMHGIILLNNPVGTPLAGVPNAGVPNAGVSNAEINMAGMNQNENGAGEKGAGASPARTGNDIKDIVGASLADAHNDRMNIDDDNIAGMNQNGNGAGMNQNEKGAGADKNEKGAGASPARTGLGDIVGAYKSIVANECLKIYKAKGQRMGKLWQRNYYEIIIRKQQSYLRISEYIVNNPSRWDRDKFYNHNLK